VKLCLRLIKNILSLSFLRFDLCLPTHCRWRGLLLHWAQSLTHTLSAELPWMRDRPVAHNAQHSQDTNIHVGSGIRTRNPKKRAATGVGLIKHIPLRHERKELGGRSTHFGSGEIHAMAALPKVLFTLEAEGNPKVIWYIRRTQKCLPPSVIWPQFAGYPADNVVAVPISYSSFF